MKHLFPIFSKQKSDKNLIYLDSAATAHKPYAVIDAMHKFYSNDYATVHRGTYSSALEITTAVEKIRLEVANFISCKQNEIVFTHSATEGINLIAYCFGELVVNKGDEVLVSIAEHHSNYLPWKMLCKRKGAKLVTFGLNKDGTFDLDDFKLKLSSKTKIVGVCHQSNVLGIVNPIEEITQLAHAKGAKVVVDGAQSIAHQKVDIKEIDADFYVFSGHKMYGPTGIGVLYGKEELLEQMLPLHYGGGMVETIGADDTFRQAPHKFEAGTPMIGGIIGLGKALEFINSIGFEKITNLEKTLSEKFFDALNDEVDFLTPLCRGASIITFIPKNIHSTDFSMMLSLENIALRSGNMCAQPLFNYLNKDVAIRISFGIYNDISDLEHFISALSTLQQIG